MQTVAQQSYKNSVNTRVIVVVHCDCFKRGYVAIGSVWRQPNLDISRQPKYQSASHILPASDCLLRKPGGWRWSGGKLFETFWFRTASIWHAPRISIIVSKTWMHINSCVSSNLHADKNAVTHETCFVNYTIMISSKPDICLKHLLAHSSSCRDLCRNYTIAFTYA